VNAVDKARMRRAFSRGAAEYDAHAVVQRRAVDRLLELAASHSRAPGRVLDVGCGTGALLARLAVAYPSAALAGIDLAPGMAQAASRRVGGARLAVADAEALPFPSAAFDLVLSTSTFQWLSRLEPAVSEARRVLARGGVVALALFGGETLHELRGAWREALPAGEPERTHGFHDRRALEAALAHAGLRADVLESETVVERHADALALLRALKRIGAGNATPGAAGCAPGGCGLGARATLDRMARAYEARHGGPAGVPATWEIVYAVARAPRDG
jgi:malonyl-CoA O-methyltransferase